MRRSPREVAFLLLALALLLFALFRTYQAVSLLPGPSDPAELGPSSTPLLPGEDLLQEAGRLDRAAREWEGEPPRRDPFRLVATRTEEKEPAPPAIPKAVLLVEERGETKVILALGARRSPPLAAGETFQGWKVVALGSDRALVEREGVLYTLPLP